MTRSITYDVAIIGGGLAGLALSIGLSRKGHSVILFEKESYPFHRVCGEYISLESWDYLLTLGVNLDEMNVPIITQLHVVSPNGNTISQKLPLGGFGLSRYRLDLRLAQLASEAGVLVREQTKVNEVTFNDGLFSIDAGDFMMAKVVCGCFGKRSNLDIKWKRAFMQSSANRLNNYTGIKYHVRGDFAKDTIGLYPFKDGYCGLVKIEEDRYNLCYLTKAANLKAYAGNIDLMERELLAKNPALSEIFSKAEKIDHVPETISQISFDKKSLVEHNILMIGDAAGMITPLCGNGMSMALHSSKLAIGPIEKFLSGQLSRKKMEERYSNLWKLHFSKRLRTGRRIQRLMGHTWSANLVVWFMKRFPSLLAMLIRQTHGNPF